MDVPVTASAVVATGVSWQADLSARRSGSGTGVASLVQGDGTTAETASMLLCPNTNGSGTYQVTVTVETSDYANVGQEGWQSTGTAATSFTVSRMVSRTDVRSVRLRASRTVVKGRVTVRSASFGRIGADFETAKVRYRAPGSSRWRTLGTALTDEFGRFTVVDYRNRPSGTRFRAQFPGDTVAEPSRSAVVRG
jgi:hypothetical protein